MPGHDTRRKSGLPWVSLSARMPRVNARHLLLPALGLLLLPGCNLQKRLDKVSANIERQYAETKDWNELPRRTISWQQALAMLKRSNEEVLKLRSTREDAEREELSIYTNMIPGLSYYGYMTRSLNRLTDEYNADDLNSNVNITFNLPALTQVPYRQYSAQARAFAAIKAEEGKVRELTTSLYQTIRQRELARRIAELDRQNPDKNDAPPTLDTPEDSDITYWQSIAKVLGDPGARWEILPETVPGIRWRDYCDRLDLLDPLVVCNYAMKLEQARLAQYGVALRYLPTINTSLYSPSLFSSSGGTYSGTFLNDEDTRLNLGVSYAVDTQLTVWNSYQKNKDNYERAKREVAADLRDHKHKVARLRNSVREYQNWRSFMQKRIEYTEKMQPDSAEGYIARAKELFDMRRELLVQEQKAIESEAALLLEYGMPGAE